MHGAIHVESEKGKGTTFTVNLPFTIAEQTESSEEETLQSVHILAVEGDPSAREYTQTVLERMGLDFNICNTGGEAIGLLQEAALGNPYDVCLIDWSLPDISGEELIRHIRQRDLEIPIVIIVSAYDIQEVEAQAKAAGADYFVPKPLFQSTVFNVLMEMTNGTLVDTTPSEKTYDFSGHRVLLAEDRELNAEIAIELLSMVHMEADCAKDGNMRLTVRASEKGHL